MTRFKYLSNMVGKIHFSLLSKITPAVWTETAGMFRDPKSK